MVSTIKGVSASPEEDNILKWNALIIGPPDTPFEDGTFKLMMVFCEKYPYRPPRVIFLSEIFHPNIYSGNSAASVYADGEISQDTLRNKWSPTYNVSDILTFIKNLLSDPNLNSPANSIAAQLFKENQREYEKRVKACVEQSWCDD